MIDDDPEMEVFKPAYNDFFMAGAEAARLHALYAVNGTAFLMDSTLSSYHSNSHALDPEERGSRIFQFQKDLASIIALFLASHGDENPQWVLQFDEQQAW